MYSSQKNRVNKNGYKNLEAVAKFLQSVVFLHDFNDSEVSLKSTEQIETFDLRSANARVHLPGVLSVPRNAHLPACRHGVRRFALRLPTPSALGVLLLLAAAGCGGRGQARFGQPCARDADCQRGLCVGGVAGDAPVCTTSCGGRNDCPGGWSCNGVTQANVVVCSKGAAMPFGEGER